MTTGKSRIVPGRYPEPGTDAVADAIRERRGDRGITPLDANLLHIPGIASGYNSMLGAIRTQGKLPGDIREAMILRIAALNHAAFEWIQHEPIGRKDGLTTGQLYVIRDIETPLPTQMNVLDAFQTAAVTFTDHSTCGAKIPWDVVQELKSRIKDWVLANSSSDNKSVDDKVDELYVEAAMVVASYNMVSRFLLSTDVAGLSDSEVPWPLERKEHLVPIVSFASDDHDLAPLTHTIHAVTLITSPDAPWLVFCNSLLTNYTMWNYVVPSLLDLSSSRGPEDGKKLTHNILLHSQRGHGKSSLPPAAAAGDKRLTTIPLLAHDVANLLQALDIPTPVRSVIGVSQGGAASLAFAALFGGDNQLTESIVACDTSSRTPTGNKEAWEERIRLYARSIGMSSLANATVPRWFPPGSLLSSTSGEGAARAQWVKHMVEGTDVQGFIQGARALSEYYISSNDLFKIKVRRVLLLAGKLDGNGKVGKGLKELCTKWKTALSEGEGSRDTGANVPPKVQFVELEGCGHLPMVDAPLRFYETLARFITDI
ncbi:Alpha/Beta hydrolase protein [Panaeolus papilionaceus]|nr:Alpha/Beta hydrolase protein [Panaeolus papilionaceus]